MLRSLLKHGSAPAPVLLFLSTVVLSVSALRLAHTMSTFANGAPKAAKRPRKVYFGKCEETSQRFLGANPMAPAREKTDDYFWLRDDERKDPDVIGYLNAENKFAEEQTGRLDGLKKRLYDEILSHLKESDEEVPYVYGTYEYYSKTEEKKAYKIHCRRALLSGSSKGAEEVVLDENHLANGYEYSDVSAFRPSPDHSLLAYGVDNNGYETYTLRVKKLQGGALLPDVIEETSGDVEWGADGSTLFYLRMDDEHRPFQLYMHVLGTPQAADVLCFEEPDRLFWAGIHKTASDRFLTLGLESKETSEVHLLDLAGLGGGRAHSKAIERKQLSCVQRRTPGVRYSVEHHNNLLYIVTNNGGAKNQKLQCIALSYVLGGAGATAASWVDVRPYDSAITVEAVQPFATFLAICGRRDGLERVWVAPVGDAGKWRELQFSEPVYSAWIDKNYDFTSGHLRLGYSSLIQPKQILEYSFADGGMTVRKTQEVPQYDPASYRTCRTHVTASDGTSIPVSMVYHKGAACAPLLSGAAVPSGTTASPSPCLLYGYGSYGACIDPTFDFKRTALLDRGVVYAIAHIRGGGEMGRQWYEDEGKYLTKRNTFTDFGACADGLARQGLTSPSQLAVVGRSAGGLLVGAAANMFPHLFKAGVADVPFVDVMNSMSDDSIPLTVGEWEEWGNPNEEKFFDYMDSYSPYDNIKAQAYPAMLVTGGLNDPRVAYWEPAKFVAKLRASKTDSNPIVFKTDMSSGHFSASDRYKFIKETAFEYAFILDQIGANVEPLKTSK